MLSGCESRWRWELLGRKLIDDGVLPRPRRKRSGAVERCRRFQGTTVVYSIEFPDEAKAHGRRVSIDMAGEDGGYQDQQEQGLRMMVSLFR